MGLVVKTREMIKFLESQGFTCARQKGTSYAIYEKGNRQTTVPIHAADIKTGTLSSILRQAGIDQKELRELREWLGRN